MFQFPQYPRENYNQSNFSPLTLWLGGLIFFATSCGLGGKHDDYDSADKTSPQQRFHGYYSECYSNRRRCSGPRPSVPTCLLPSGMPGGLAVGQLSALVGHVCTLIRQLKQMEQPLRWLASTDGSTTSLCRPKKAKGDLSPRRAQQPWWVLTPLCSPARGKKQFGEEEEGQCREWKGRGEADPSSNRWEAHGRHSETQTKPKEHEIPLTRAVPSLPRQISPGSNSPSSRGPPSPALFPQLINLGFSEGQTLRPSPWWPKTRAGPNLGPLRPLLLKLPANRKGVQTQRKPLIL